MSHRALFDLSRRVPPRAGVDRLTRDATEKPASRMASKLSSAVLRDKGGGGSVGAVQASTIYATHETQLDHIGQAWHIGQAGHHRHKRLAGLTRTVTQPPNIDVEREHHQWSLFASTA